MVQMVCICESSHQTRQRQLDTGQIWMVRKAVVASSLAQSRIGGRQRGPPNITTLLPLGCVSRVRRLVLVRTGDSGSSSLIIIW